MKTVFVVLLTLVLAAAAVRVGSHELKARGGCPVLGEVRHASVKAFSNEPRVILAQNDVPFPQPDGNSAPADPYWFVDPGTTVVLNIAIAIVCWLVC